jgi:hypothetical protein
MLDYLREENRVLREQLGTGPNNSPSVRAVTATSDSGWHLD